MESALFSPLAELQQSTEAAPIRKRKLSTGLVESPSLESLPGFNSPGMMRTYSSDLDSTLGLAAPLPMFNGESSFGASPTFHNRVNGVSLSHSSTEFDHSTHAAVGSLPVFPSLSASITDADGFSHSHLNGTDRLPALPSSLRDSVVVGVPVPDAGGSSTVATPHAHEQTAAAAVSDGLPHANANVNGDSNGNGNGKRAKGNKRKAMNKDPGAESTRDVIDLTDLTASKEEAMKAAHGDRDKGEKKVKVKKKKKDEIRFEDIKLEEKIGEGSFGEVYRCTLWGQEVAMKRMHRIKNVDAKIKEFRKEVKIMRGLRHPNIVEVCSSCCFCF